MAIKTITGDLIKSALNGEFDVIAHQANCFNTMGSGIALSIRKEWPESATVDNATMKGDRMKLGTISHTQNTTPIIVNLYGQFDYWSPGVLTDYDALEKALIQMKTMFPNKKIGMPKIGSLRARGDWNVIYAIIQRVFCDDSDDVTIVEWEQDASKGTSLSTQQTNGVLPAPLLGLSAFNNPNPSITPSGNNTTPIASLSPQVVAVKKKRKFHGKRKCRICKTYHSVREMRNYIIGVWVCDKNCNQSFLNKVLDMNNINLNQQSTSVQTDKSIVVPA